MIGYISKIQQSHWRLSNQTKLLHKSSPIQSKHNWFSISSNYRLNKFSLMLFYVNATGGIVWASPWVDPAKKHRSDPRQISQKNIPALCLEHELPVYCKRNVKVALRIFFNLLMSYYRHRRWNILYFIGDPNLKIWKRSPGLFLRYTRIEIKIE